MSSGRGTDSAIERRQLRNRSDKEGVDRWLENVFFAAGETTLLGLPALVLLMDAEPQVPVKFAALFAWSTLSIAVGTVRGGWVPVAPAWIRKTRRSILALLVFHNVVLWTAATGGARAEVAFGSPVISLAVAVSVPAVCVLAMARAAEWIGLRTLHPPG